MNNVRKVGIYNVDSVKDLLLKFADKFPEGYIDETYGAIYDQFMEESEQYIQDLENNPEHQYANPPAGSIQEFIDHIVKEGTLTIDYNKLNNVEKEYFIWLLCLMMFCSEHACSYTLLGYDLISAKYKNKPIVYFKNAFENSSVEQVIENYKIVIGIT